MNQVIALVGMCGSGKSVCCEEFQKSGWDFVYFGGVTMKELEKRGLERNEVNERAVREELRKTYGPAAFAILLQDEIKEKLKDRNVCLDGLYSWSELKILREALGDALTVVAIITERKKRYERISQRVIRPLTPAQAESRDIAEIENMEKGGPIAMADLFLFNDDDIEAFRASTRAIISRAENGEL
ncbi:MAG: AAA family ATPase [Clostridia bacterium]|nr:AAA family ATPase [Clostridia bacterium]